MYFKRWLILTFLLWPLYSVAADDFAYQAKAFYRNQHYPEYVEHLMLSPIEDFVHSHDHLQHSQESVMSAAKVFLKTSKVFDEVQTQILEALKQQGITTTQLRSYNDFLAREEISKLLNFQTREEADGDNPIIQIIQGYEDKLRDAVNQHLFNAMLTRAKAGNSDAQYQLSSCYEQGLGVGVDHKLAFHWLQKAADNQLADAQNDLAVAYALGKGVKRNAQLAHVWYERAAKLGNRNAITNLAEQHYHGYVDAKPDYAKAFALFHRAAMMGDACAPQALAILYAKGRGTKRDKELARNWFEGVVYANPAEEDEGKTSAQIADTARQYADFELAKYTHLKPKHIDTKLIYAFQKLDDAMASRCLGADLD